MNREAAVKKMATENELPAKDRQQLTSEVLRLEKSLAEARKSREFYCNLYGDLNKRFQRYREAVKSVVLLIE
jgi:hypothetical protein